MIIKANGIDYFVQPHQKTKNKISLIMLHGFMGSSFSYEYNIPLLKSFCNPITIDLLGHGKTEGAKSAGRFYFKYQIDDLHQIIKKITTEKPLLYGYSMGGRLALRYALQHQESIRGLILESTNWGLDNKSEIQERKRVDRKRARAINNNFKAFLKEWQEADLFQSEINLASDRQNHYYSIQEEQSPRQMARNLIGFGTAQMPSVKDQLDQLDLPVLLLAGAHDKKYTKIMRQMHRLIPDSRLEIIQNASHRVHFNNTNDHASVIEKFISNF